MSQRGDQRRPLRGGELEDEEEAATRRAAESGLVKGNGESKGPEACVRHGQKASVGGGLGEREVPDTSMWLWSEVFIHLPIWSFLNQTLPGTCPPIPREGTRDKGKNIYYQRTFIVYSVPGTFYTFYKYSFISSS